MTDGFTLKRLDQVKDSAPESGFRGQQTRFASADLNADTVGLAHHRFEPGKRQEFAHFHEQAEEIYVVISGAGRMKLDDAVVELGPLDAVRVEPQVVRAFEAGPDGLEVIAFGARHDGDGDVIPNWWT